MHFADIDSFNLDQIKQTSSVDIKPVHFILAGLLKYLGVFLRAIEQLIVINPAA